MCSFAVSGVVVGAALLTPWLEKCGCQRCLPCAGRIAPSAQKKAHSNAGRLWPWKAPSSIFRRPRPGGCGQVDEGGIDKHTMKFQGPGFGILMLYCTGIISAKGREPTSRLPRQRPPGRTLSFLPTFLPIPASASASAHAEQRQGLCKDPDKVCTWCPRRRPGCRALRALRSKGRVCAVEQCPWR